MIWSSVSMVMAPSLTRWARKVATFFAYIWLACWGTVAGRLTAPTTETLWAVTTLSGWVTSTLPPCSAARSTITEPGAIPATMSALISTGAFLPGTSAVVMTTSLAATTLAIVSCWRR